MNSSVLEFELAHCCEWGFQTKIKNRMANSVDPDETAHYKQSHLDLHSLHRCWFWSAGLKGLTEE